MKITNYDDLYPIALGTGMTIIGGSTGSNSGYTGGDIEGEPGDLTVLGLRSTVSLSSNMGDNTLGTVLTTVQSSPWVAQFAVSSNTASTGSNSMTRTLGGQETPVTVAASGTTEALNVAGGNVFDVTLTANCTLSFTNVPAGVVCAITVLLKQDGTGSRTVTWPGSVVWPGGVTPVLSTGAGEVDVFALFTLDTGTTWYGFPTGNSGGSALTIEDEGTPLATAATTLDFVGAGVTASGAGAEKTITIPGVAAAAVSALGFRGELLISSTPSNPIVFADVMLNSDGTDFVYASIP